MSVQRYKWNVSDDKIKNFFFRIDRGYDFTGVLEWFAERVDRIILLFDAHKLDISDEFKRCIEALSGIHTYFIIIYSL